jgi:hypothetical protein
MYEGWCWKYHYAAGAVSIMADSEACNARLHYTQACTRKLKFGLDKVTVSDIPTDTDPSGIREHHSHEEKLGDDKHDPVKALRYTWPLIANYRRHGCDWHSGMVIKTHTVLGLGRSSSQDIIGGVAWKGLSDRDCAETCQLNGLWQATIGSMWLFDEACSAVMYDFVTLSCYFFRENSYTFYYVGHQYASKRRC